jgi:hypothetical protein
MRLNMQVLRSFMLMALMAAAAHSDPLLELLPGAEVSGPPGAIVGWGYRLSNDDAERWLVTSAIAADPFEHATPRPLFDFPVLSPGAELTVEFLPVTAGLFQLRWDEDTPIGFMNTGVFTINAEWWDDNPLSGGVYLEAAPDFTVEYIARTSPPSEGTVPEPDGGVLALGGLALLFGSRILRFRSHRRSV